MAEFKLWDGSALQPLKLLGEWDGQAVRPLTLQGEWDGDSYTDEVAPTPNSQPVIQATGVVISSSSLQIIWKVISPGTEAITGWDNGRDGNEANSTSGPWSTIDPPSADRRVFDRLAQDAPYNLYVQAKTATGASNKVVVSLRTSSGASTEPQTPAPSTGGTTGGRIALVGSSGLGFNATVFSGGYDTAPSQAFASWRKRPIDGHLYFAARQSWSDFRGAVQSQQKALLDQGKLVILSLPPAPEQYGTSMWAQVLNGTHDAEWRSFGAFIASQGWNRSNFVIRLGWEGNGNWYAWSYLYAPGNNNSEKAANVAAGYRRIITAIRAGGGTNVRFNQCWNKGPSHSGFDFAAFPGKDYVDVVGIDQYDRYGEITNRNGTAVKGGGINELARVPSVKTIAEFARAQGIQWSIDEWGVWHGDSSDPNGGGDNGIYPHFIWDAVQANRDILAWENTYDDNGAPASARHKLSNGQNPNAAASYLSHWGG